MAEPNELSDEQLAAWLQFPVGVDQWQKAQIELTRRNIRAQNEAAKAQREAIEVQKIAAAAATKAEEATKRAAVAAERNANYMLASVIIAAFAAIVSAVATFWSVVHSR